MMYDKLIKGIYKYGKKTIKRQIVKSGIEKAAREANEDIDDFITCYKCIPNLQFNIADFFVLNYNL